MLVGLLDVHGHSVLVASCDNCSHAKVLLYRVLSVIHFVIQKSYFKFSKCRCVVKQEVNFNFFLAQSSLKMDFCTSCRRDPSC